jgi:hypothetical protein
MDHDLLNTVYCVFYLDFCENDMIYRLDSIHKLKILAEEYVATKSCPDEYSIEAWELHS